MSKIIFLKLPAVIERTGLSKASIYKLMLLELFPRPIPLIGDHVGWVEEHVDRYNQFILDAAPAETIKAFVASVNPPSRKPKMIPLPIPRIRVRRRA